MVLFFYGFLWLSALYNLFVIFYIRSSLKKLPMLDVESLYAKIKYYPIMMAILWTPPSINRILQMTGNDIFMFQVLHICCECSYGFCNMMLYAINPRVKKIILNKIRKIFNHSGEDISMSSLNDSKLHSFQINSF